jgi:general secretion pathway protein H
MDHSDYLRRSSGFSLLELLVVVFIIGILATMMTLSIGTTGGDRELEQELDRLQALIDLAAEEAVLQGQEMGIRFYPTRYEFSTETWETTEAEESETAVARWSLVSGDALFKPRDLGEDFIIELEIDGRAVVLESYSEPKRRGKDDENDKDDADPYLPQVFILSSGDLTPFTLYVKRRFRNEGLILKVEGDGSIEQLRDDV